MIVDVVYGHTGVDFPYYDAYTRLRYHENPFMGPFAKDYFSNFGKSTDFGRPLTRDFFFTVNHHWLEVYHVDGFRYDCVPNYWDGPLGVGYASLVYETYQLTKAKLARSAIALAPFRRRPRRTAATHPVRRAAGRPRGDPAHDLLQQHLAERTFDAARSVARGDRGAARRLGLAAGSFRLSRTDDSNGDLIPKTALQYLENHDHERFICNFGLTNPDEAGNPLFLEGDRSRWFMLQPYLIATLMSKGIPMLWQGEEFGENYFLPDFGAGRVALLRPLRWDYFYDDAGQASSRWSASYFGCDATGRNCARAILLLQRLGPLSVARRAAVRPVRGPAYTLVAVNTTDTEQTVPFWFPIAGDYVEELHGGDLDLKAVPRCRRRADDPLALRSHLDCSRTITTAGCIALGETSGKFIPRRCIATARGSIFRSITRSAQSIRAAPCESVEDGARETRGKLHVGPFEAIDAIPVVDIKPVLRESADW